MIVAFWAIYYVTVWMLWSCPQEELCDAHIAQQTHIISSNTTTLWRCDMLLYEKPDFVLCSTTIVPELTLCSLPCFRAQTTFKSVMTGAAMIWRVQQSDDTHHRTIFHVSFNIIQRQNIRSSSLPHMRRKCFIIFWSV